MVIISEKQALVDLMTHSSRNERRFEGEALLMFFGAIKGLCFVAFPHPGA